MFLFCSCCCGFCLLWLCVCGFVFCSSASCGVGVLFMWSRILAGSQVASPLAMQGCGLLCAMWFHALVSCGFMLWCHVVSCSGVMWSCMSFMSCEVAFFMGSCLLHHVMWSCHLLHVMWSFRLLHVMWSFRLPCVTWSCHLPVVELLPSPCLELPPSSCGVAAFFMSCGVTIFSAPCPVESLSVLSSS